MSYRNSLQRRYRSLERRRESKKMPKMPKLPEKIFYRILDDGSGNQSQNKKHVKFQLLGEDDDAKMPLDIPCSELSPIPARYCISVCSIRGDTFFYFFDSDIFCKIKIYFYSLIDFSRTSKYIYRTTNEILV